MIIIIIITASYIALQCQMCVRIHNMQTAFIHRPYRDHLAAHVQPPLPCLRPARYH
jgi:hypothetical protein